MILVKIKEYYYRIIDYNKKKEKIYTHITIKYATYEKNYIANFSYYFFKNKTNIIAKRRKKVKKEEEKKNLEKK